MLRFLAVMCCSTALWWLWAPTTTPLWPGDSRCWEQTRYGVFGYHTEQRCALMPIAGGIGNKLWDSHAFPEPRASTDAESLGLTIAVSVLAMGLSAFVVRLVSRCKAEFVPATESV